MNNGNTQHGSGTVSPAYASDLLAAEAVRDLIIAAINNDPNNNQVSGHATFASRKKAAAVTSATLAQLDVTWLADAGPDSPPTGASPAIAAAVLETINSTKTNNNHCINPPRPLASERVDPSQVFLFF